MIMKWLIIVYYQLSFQRTIFKGFIVHVVAFMKLIIGLIIFSVLVAGCISPDVKTGNPLQYELPGMENTTIFYLNLSSTQVIENVINQTSVDYRIDDSIQTFRNPVAVDYRGNNASLNVTIKTIMGRNYAHFNFSTNFSGFVAYTRPGGQDFTYIPDRQQDNTCQFYLKISQPGPCSWDISSQIRITLHMTHWEEKSSSGITP